MKIHFWAGAFTPERFRKYACGRKPQLGEFAECDDFDEFLALDAEKLCAACSRALGIIERVAA